MGILTSEQPKCMTEISNHETILSRQLHQLLDIGINDVVITTGAFEAELINYVQSLDLPLNIKFVNNPKFKSTNYIYSIYCAKDYLDDDILLMHGDLVFENQVIDKLIQVNQSSMIVSSSTPLPQKDFKAVIKDNYIVQIGIDCFESAMTAQPLYKILHEDWKIWLKRIIEFCESNQVNCYAENAFNEVSDDCKIYPLDVRNLLCNEIDNPQDLAVVASKLNEVESRTVYMAFSTEILHSGHIALLKKASRFGKLIIGVLTDEAVASYKRFPIMSCNERKTLFKNISGVYKVVEQDEASYVKNLLKYKPDYVVNGDDWKIGIMKPIRDEVVECLASYGGKLIEFPYARSEEYRLLDKRMRKESSLPDMRRSRLKKMIDVKGLITAIEAHDGLTGLIAEQTVVNQPNGGTKQFDAMWISSLCDSTAKGKPDTGIVDMTSRMRTIEDIVEVTTKPIIFDGDNGGLKEHFIFTVRSLERLGVSMIIIEDKIGLKKNSLFGTEVKQTQDSIEDFCEKISMGKKAQKTKDFMICARIESLILERGLEDALTRAFAYVDAGADAIMIHSRKNIDTPPPTEFEIFSFIERFRAENKSTPLVVVPTSFNSITEEEFKSRGVNIVIYANQLMRASVPAMQKVAESILINHRSLECDEFCMPFKDIIRFIPEEF